VGAGLVTDGPGRAFALTGAQQRLAAEARTLAREVLARRDGSTGSWSAPSAPTA
jgi:hypothetical protein